MKRPDASRIPELPSPPRRKRSLSEEERALWEDVARPEALAAALETEMPTALTSSSSRPPPAKPTARSDPPPAAPPLVPLGRRERSQLSRGRKEIEARLDLHGMTQSRAHRALLPP